MRDLHTKFLKSVLKGKFASVLN